MSLHSYNSDLRPEPGSGKGLTTASFAIGGTLIFTVVEDFEVFANVGVGVGFFGVQHLAEAVGLALHSVAGIRYSLGDIVSLCATFFVVGPKRQLKLMSSPTRRITAADRARRRLLKSPVMTFQSRG